jgi:hypothetical protein
VRKRERAHVSDLARHEELERILATSVGEMLEICRMGWPI